MLKESLIEHQHHELVSLLTGLNEAITNRESRKIIYQLIDDVIAYTRLHFSTEEQLMAQSGYPDIEWHKNQHNQLLEDALHFRKKLDYIGEDIFTDWYSRRPFARVLAHIQFADRQVADFFIQNKDNR
jgi:hemerythrin